MNALPVLAILALVGVSGCSAVSAAQVTVVTPAWVERDAGAQFVDEKANVRPSRELLFVHWDQHYGYFLSIGPGWEPGFIAPEFANVEVRRVFEDLDIPFNPSLIGKKIRCDCSGERYERSGRPYFLIREARVFAE